MSNLWQLLCCTVIIGHTRCRDGPEIIAHIIADVPFNVQWAHD